MEGLLKCIYNARPNAQIQDFEIMPDMLCHLFTFSYDKLIVSQYNVEGL